MKTIVSIAQKGVNTMVVKNISIRNIARLTDVGISTVQRLKKEFKIA